MQLVPFHGLRVGFWLASSPATARAELTERASPEEHGTKSDGGVTLVVAAADDADAIAWSHLVHADEGAALCAEWGPRLVVAVGGELRVLDAGGRVVGGHAADDVLVNAHVADGALVLVGRKSVRVLDAPGTLRWSRAVRSGGLMFRGLRHGTLEFAAFPESGDDWFDLGFGFADGTPADM